MIERAIWALDGLAVWIGIHWTLFTIAVALTIAGWAAFGNKQTNKQTKK